MEEFLTCLEEYDLLIELILTVLTISLSLFAVFQTKSIAKRQLEQEKNIAKQQADLQEKQIKISVYEQKNEINKALDEVFGIVNSINILLTKIDLHKFSKEQVYSLLNCYIENTDINNISYVLEQSRFFLKPEVSQNISFIKICFSTISIYTNLIKSLNDDEEVTKSELIDEIVNSATKIKEMESAISSAMIQELKIVD